MHMLGPKESADARTALLQAFEQSYRTRGGLQDTKNSRRTFRLSASIDKSVPMDVRHYRTDKDSSKTSSLPGAFLKDMNISWSGGKAILTSKIAIDSNSINVYGSSTSKNEMDVSTFLLWVEKNGCDLKWLYTSEYRFLFANNIPQTYATGSSNSHSSQLTTSKFKSIALDYSVISDEEETDRMLQLYVDIDIGMPQRDYNARP